MRARHGHALDDGDCDDTAADVHPGAEPLCDGEDHDCDGEVDAESLAGTDAGCTGDSCLGIREARTDAVSDGACAGSTACSTGPWTR